MALTLRYFNEFAKPAFQLITGFSSIELIDQKSACIRLKHGQSQHFTYYSKIRHPHRIENVARKTPV